MLSYYSLSMEILVRDPLKNVLGPPQYTTDMGSLALSAKSVFFSERYIGGPYCSLHTLRKHRPPLGINEVQGFLKASRL